MKRIMVLEDEFFLLNSMTKYLSALPDVKVYGYSTVKTACEALRLHPPDLIFSDIRLPDGLGLQLIDELIALEMAVPLVFISAYVADHRDRIPSHHNISLLEKPLSLKRLREVAEQKLASVGDPNSAFFFKLSDYLQIAAMGQHSVRVCCENQACIEIVEGLPWHAFDEQGQGEAAFKRIIASWESEKGSAQITCQRLSSDDLGPQTLHGSLNGLLLDAVREVDETSRESQSAEGADSKVEQFDTYFERGVELMLDKKYQQAHEALTMAHQIDPSHGVVRANLERLDQLIQQHQERRELV